MTKFGILKKRAATLSFAHIRKCPHVIMAFNHYDENGSCRCKDPDHKEMAEWGYTWKDGQWR